MKRDEITVIHHPNKMNLDQFVKMIKEDVDGWAENLRLLAKEKPSIFNKKYPEQWADSMLAWAEIHFINV